MLRRRRRRLLDPRDVDATLMPLEGHMFLRLSNEHAIMIRRAQQRRGGGDRDAPGDGQGLCSGRGRGHAFRAVCFFST